MEHPIDDQQVQALLAEGVTQNEIARRLHIPPTTLKRHIKKSKGIPKVYNDVHIAAPLTTLQDDLAEVLAWWRERKQLTQPANPERETERKTYHVEKCHITAIERASDLERVSITEIVNRAFRRYFEGKQT